MNEIERAKEIYNSIEIPPELEGVVDNSIKRFEQKRKGMAKIHFIRLAPVAACAVICLVIGIGTLTEKHHSEGLITEESADAGVPMIARSVPSAGAGISTDESDAVAEANAEGAYVYGAANKNDLASKQAGEVEKLPFEEPLEMFFSSGAGAWSTDLVLNNDGTFTGYFSDTNAGELGEGYPNGTVRYCKFSGMFSNIEKLDDLTYSLKLSSLSVDEEEGKEHISEGIRYISSKAYGLLDGENFVFYLPEKPVSVIPEEELVYWHGTEFWIGENKETLSCYGLVNRDAKGGFFSNFE